MSSLIRFEDVSYIYGRNLSFEVKALNHIDLEIEEGSFVGLIGHTGSGKSTLLQHMNGLLAASSGRVLYKDQDIMGEHFNRSKLCSKVGLVFQYPEYQLFEETILKDVAYGPKNLGLSEAEANARAKEALMTVGIPEEEYDKSPFELSGGQKRRVAIAGILAMKPELLVVDEPAAGLDPLGKQELLGLIADLHQKEGMTVVLSSHSMEDMARYAQRILVMNAGEIVLDGSPAEVFGQRAFLEEIGLSAPEIVYFMDRLKAMGIALPEGILTIDDAADAIAQLWHQKRGEGQP